MRRFAIVAALAATVLLVLAGATAATPQGPVLQVQNGNTFQAPLGAISFAASGEAGQPGGITWTYSGVDSTLLSQFSDLEWGPAGASALRLSANDPGFTGSDTTLVFDSLASNLAQGVAEWSTPGPISWPGGSVTGHVKVTVTDGSNNPIAWQTFAGYGDGATVPISGNFKVNVQALAGTQPFDTAFTAANTQAGGSPSAQDYEDLSFGFYYVAAPTGPVVTVSPYDFQVVKQGYPQTHDITVTNTGSSDLHVTSVATGGDFSIPAETCTGTAVAPNGTCTVTVRFAPTADGPIDGTLTLADDAGNTPQSVNLHGYGIHGAVTITPPANNFAFGSQTTNTTSSVTTVALTSTGTTDVKVGQITVGAPFGLVNDTCSNTDLAQNASCTIGIVFSPTAAGPQSATLSVPSDDPSSPATATLGGTGVLPAPAVGLPAALAFGGEGIGVPTTKTATITNTGTLPLHVSSASAGGDFSVTNDACEGVAVAPGATCTIDVRFLPSARGPETGSLSISSDAASSPDQLGLSGTGLDSTFTLTPSPLDFGTVHVGQSQQGTLTFTNSGQDTADFLAPPSVSGDTGDFTFEMNTFTCLVNGHPGIAAQSSCSVQFSFAPTTGGTRTVTYSFPNDSRDGPSTSVMLTGVGVDPKLSASPSLTAFGPQALGTSSTNDVTITNTGTTPLTISGITPGGSNPGDFSVDASSCTAPVQPQGTCVLHVHFQPAAVGSRSANVSIASDALSSPDVVSFTGTGIDPHVSVPPTDFGSTVLGHDVTQTIAVASTGQTPLTVQSVSVSGPAFSIVSDGCSLQTVASGSTCPVTVKLSGAVGGTFHGTLTVTSNAASSPDGASLTGSVLAGTFAASPAGSGSFGNVVDGSSGRGTVTVTNVGTSPLDVSGLSIVGAPVFAIDPASTCTASTTLAPGGTCQVLLTFSPTVDGPYSAALELTGDGTNSPFDVQLSGTGVSPKLSVNPLGLVFGIQPVIGHLTAGASTQTITVTSAGTSALTISSVAVMGPFVITGDACSLAGPLPPGTQCQLQVAFVPTQIGLAHGTVTLASDGGNVPIALSGTGIDQTPPVLSNVPGNMTLEATGPGGAAATYTAPTATDNVDPTPTVGCAPASGSTFPLGTTTVTCTATDVSGNTATGSFTVTVRDTTPPALSGVPSSQTVPATGPNGAVVTFALPTATDAVDGPITPVCVPAPGATFAIGTTTVVCRATDAHGNSASASFSVTVTGAVAQIQALQAQVDGLPELQPKAAKQLLSSLDSYLQTALADLTGKHPSVSGSCKALASFASTASDPRNVVPRGPLTAADSASLVSQAGRIRTVLGC